MLYSVSKGIVNQLQRSSFRIYDYNKRDKIIKDILLKG